METQNEGKIQFTINLNPNEKAYFDLKAKELGISLSEVARRLAKEKIKQEGLVELEEFIPCSSKDFEDLDQIFPEINIKQIPIMNPNGSGDVVKAIWKGDFPIFSDNSQIQKEIIETIEFCKLNHVPFALQDFLKNPNKQSDDFCKSEYFMKTEEGFKFRNSKNIYKFRLSEEAKTRQKREFELGEIERANQRNAEYWKEQHIRDEEEKIKREFFRKKAILNIEKKEKLKSQEQIQQEEIEKALVEKQNQKSKSLVSEESETSSTLNENKQEIEND